MISRTTFIWEGTGRRDSVTDIWQTEAIETNKCLYSCTNIPPNLLPIPFIPLFSVSWNATGLQVNIRHRGFKKTNRLPTVYQALTHARVRLDNRSIAFSFLRPVCLFRFQPARCSLSLILTYVHEFLQRTPIAFIRTFLRNSFGLFVTTRKSGKPRA